MLYLVDGIVEQNRVRLERFLDRNVTRRIAAMVLERPPSSAPRPSIWKKRTPRLVGSALVSDDSDEDDTAPMDVATGSRSDSSYEGCDPSVYDRDVATSNPPTVHGGRKKVELLTDEEFSKIVHRIDSMCQNGLWGCALEHIDELLARRCDEKVLEMKAQILMELRRDYDAIRCCEGSIKLNPLWWVAHNTHGRALLAFGEPHLALKAFQRALRLNPADDELREEFHWTRRNTHGFVPADGCDFRNLVRRR